MIAGAEKCRCKLRPEKSWIHASGRGFDSRHLHQFRLTRTEVLPGPGSGGRGIGRRFGPIRFPGGAETRLGDRVGPPGCDDLEEAGRELIAGDLGVVYVVDVELDEDQFVHSSTKIAVGSPVTGLWILEQVEGHHKELMAGGQTAAGVLELLVDFPSLVAKPAQLDLELVFGPPRLADELKQAVLLFIELAEAIGQQLPGRGQARQLGFEQRIQLRADLLLKFAGSRTVL